MAFRVSKRVGRGGRISAGKRGVSASLGGRGLRVTPNSRGTVRITGGIPGTGVYYSKQLGSSRKRTPSQGRRGRTAGDQSQAGVPVGQRPIGIITWLVLFFPVGLYLMWQHAPWSRGTKWVISGIFFWPLWLIMIRENIQSWRQLGLIGAVLLAGYIACVAVSPGFAVVGMAGFWWAITLREPDPVPDMPASVDEFDREEVEAELRKCDDMVFEIERTVMLDLLLPDSLVKRRYREGLELRAEAIQRLARAASVNDARDAKAQAMRAQEAFQAASV